MKQIWKRRAVAAAVVVLVGTYTGVQRMELCKRHSRTGTDG